MLFLQSLFCWSGADNRYRFSLIVALSHVFFIIFSAIFHASFFISFIILLLSTIVITCTTKRRLSDGKLTKNWLYTPSVSFALIGLIIISFNHQALYWLTLLSAALSSILLTYPGSNSNRYVYGYYGPINLASKKNSPIRSHRIEPTLMNQHLTVNVDNVNSFNNPISSSTQYQEETYYNESTHDNNPSQDLGELIRSKLLNNQNSKYTILGLLAIITVAMFTSLILSISDSNETSINQQENMVENSNTVNDKMERKNKITLPDDFSLMTTPFKGVIIHWQADINNVGNLWNIRQATGERNCQSIQFNNNDSYRTTLVLVENSNEYVAEFSPLDTINILKSIANRSDFTLCGYSFSLKGSQSALSKHSFYSDILAQ
ncbi:MAG: hypothetical protein P8I03_08610 [Thalassotalea sp.]|nr:hypothetical protein [Thalassotalea sp.]